MATLTQRLPEIADLLDTLSAADRQEVEDAYLRLLASAPRRRPRSLHAAIRSHPPEVAAGAVARGLAREKATREAMVAASWSTAEVAQLLGVSPAAVTKRRAKGGLVAFRHKEDWRYPQWQFRAGRVLDAVVSVWQMLPDRHDVAGLVRWFTLPSRQLGGATPLEAIRRGDVEAAIDAATYVGSR